MGIKASEILTQKVLTVDHEATLSEAMGKMIENRIHTLPVMDGKKYIGMASYREILRRKSVNPKSKIVNFSVPSPGVEENTPIEDIVRTLRDSGLRAVPVLRKGAITGIISRTDILRRIDDIMDASAIRCRDMMSTNPMSVRMDDGIEKAQEIFKTLDVTELPVVNDSGKVEGILRIADISPEILGGREKISYGQVTGSKHSPTAKASSLMSIAVTADENDSLSACSKKMVENKLHVIPVSDRNGKLVGVIENSDIIDFIAGQYSQGGLLISVSGLESDEESLLDATFFLGDKFVQKFARLTGHRNGTLNIHVIKYNTEGEIKYSVRTRLLSGNITMSIDSFDWNYAKCLSEIFDVYEKRLKKTLKKD